MNMASSSNALHRMVTDTSLTANFRDPTLYHTLDHRSNPSSSNALHSMVAETSLTANSWDPTLYHTLNLGSNPVYEVASSTDQPEPGVAPVLGSANAYDYVDFEVVAPPSSAFSARANDVRIRYVARVYVCVQGGVYVCVSGDWAAGLVAIILTHQVPLPRIYYPDLSFAVRMENRSMGEHFVCTSNFLICLGNVNNRVSYYGNVHCNDELYLMVFSS